MEHWRFTKTMRTRMDQPHDISYRGDMMRVNDMPSMKKIYFVSHCSLVTNWSLSRLYSA